MPSIRPALLALGLAVAVAPAAAAQPDDDRLPSLTPQEFVIRGAVQVNLPQLERQPLTGFGPPPRTFVLAADRTPTELAFDPNIDALPALGLDGPSAPPLDLPEARRFRVEGGGGALAARYGRVDLDVGGASGRFYVDADYDGLGGGTVDPTEREVEFDRLDLRGGGQTLGTTRLSLDGRVRLDTYSLPGAFDDFLGQSRRERRHLGVRAGIEGIGATPYALSVGYASNRIGPTDETLGAAESRGRLDAEASVAPGRLRLDARGGTSSESDAGSAQTFGSAGAALQLGRDDGARLLVGVRGLTYTDDSVNGDSRTLGPVVDLGLPLGEAASLFAVNDPHLAVRSLMDLTDENPFVVQDPTLAPDVFVADGRAGLAIRAGDTRLRFYGLGSYAPTRLVYRREANGLFQTDYQEVTTFGGGADLAFTRPGGASLSLGAEVRGSSTELDTSLPFYAGVVTTAGVQLPFAAGRGRAGLSVRAEALRPDATDDPDAEADPFALVALDARYDITGPLSLTARAERLVGTTERWPGFPVSGPALMVGLRLAR